MHTREFPVLDEADESLVNRLAAGLGDDAARVLAYLLMRERYLSAENEPESGPDPATRLAVRIGTDLNRETVATALNRLAERDLLATTTLRTSARGRPPKAWRPAGPEDVTTERVDASHGERLVTQATDIAAATGSNARGTDGKRSSPIDRTDGDRDEGTTESEGEHEPFRLGLNWDPNGLHAPFFMARSAGHYGSHDLSVSIHRNRGSGAAIECITSGESDVALAGAATVVRARCEGARVVPIALLFQRAMATLYTTREAFGEPFERVHQLQGRRVGTSRHSETGLLGRLFLSQAGVLEDAMVVDIAGEERAALREGRADVVTGSFADPRRLRAAGAAVDALVVADQFPMYGPALVTTEPTLNAARPRLEAFLAGTTAGWADAVAEPATAVRAIDGLDVGEERESSDSDGDRGAIKSERALEREQHTFEQAVREFGTSADVTNHGWGWHETAGWRRLETALEQVDLV